MGELLSLQGKKLLIAGGGTGGHLFPAIAVADEWEAQGGAVLFVGTPRGLENRVLPKLGKNLALIKVGKLKGGGILGKLRTVAGLPLALVGALRILRQFKPDVVLGVGGYASAPAVAAARLLFIPTALHEQNAMPGLTNRLLARIAKRIFLSFAAARDHFNHSDMHLTGNPVNSAFHSMDPKPLPDGTKPFEILIFGGSLGARVFGELIPPALEELHRAGFRFKVQHQVQKDSLERVRKFYADCGIDAVTATFFDDMKTVYARADLVICRAGATSVAELSALGKPALLIPYPFAADDHQAANAKAYAASGAGWMRRQEETTKQWLVDFLKKRLENPADLQSAAENARKLATPDAAGDIVQGLITLT